MSERIEAHCGCCGWTEYFSRAEVECEDIRDGQACVSCGVGPVRLSEPPSVVDRLAELVDDD